VCDSNGVSTCAKGSYFHFFFQIGHVCKKV
jgi:hypothetical protein